MPSTAQPKSRPEASQTLIKEVTRLTERVSVLQKEVTALKRTEKVVQEYIVKEKAKVQTIGAIGKILYIGGGFAAGLLSAYATFKGLK